jgi:endonuclease YncB( thermonuclease family)
MPAAALLCLVIAVADGDTLMARCAVADGMENIKVRLAEIDAPEKGQAFGARSKQHLAELCSQKQATVTPRTKDRYLRTVANVECQGADAGTEQVRAGMAWVFDRYVTDRSLYAVQDEARATKRGLWADPSPTPPWEWRKGERQHGSPSVTSLPERSSQ